MELINIEKINNRFAIANANDKEDLCLVVGKSQWKDDGPGPFPLKEGSVFKIGKSKIEIDKIVYNKEKRNQKKTFYEDPLYSLIEQKIILEQEFNQNTSQASTIEELPFCRYCYSKTNEKENALKILCQCDGSTKYVHEKCIQQWVVQKSNFRATRTNIFSADKQKLKCELCHSMFPYEQVLPCFNKDQKKQYIILTIQIQKIQSVRIIFLSEDKNDEISIGRREEGHIVIPDISVSRQHCRLIWDYKTGSLTVQDLGSKFGTLLKKNGLQIRKATLMQLGKTKFLFSIQPQQMLAMKKIKSLINFTRNHKR